MHGPYLPKREVAVLCERQCLLKTHASSTSVGEALYPTDHFQGLAANLDVGERKGDDLRRYLTCPFVVATREGDFRP